MLENIADEIHSLVFCLSPFFTLIVVVGEVGISIIIYGKTDVSGCFYVHLWRIVGVVQFINHNRVSLYT